MKKLNYDNNFENKTLTNSNSAGKRLRSGKLPKIIGLDPASPLFSLNKPNERLDSHDAIYVETVHTSRLGFFDPLGDVSFYANGGRSQPECKSWDVVSLPEHLTINQVTKNYNSHFVNEFFICQQLCHHQTAYMYFAHTIHSKEPFFGQLCNSLSDLKKCNCSINGQKRAILGGEPGLNEQ